MVIHIQDQVLALEMNIDNRFMIRIVTYRLQYSITVYKNFRLCDHDVYRSYVYHPH